MPRSWEAGKHMEMCVLPFLLCVPWCRKLRDSQLGLGWNAVHDVGGKTCERRVLEAVGEGLGWGCSGWISVVSR